MSLRVDDRSSRRDRSSTRDRDRSRSNVRTETRSEVSTYEIRPEGVRPDRPSYRDDDSYERYDYRETDTIERRDDRSDVSRRNDYESISAPRRKDDRRDYDDYSRRQDDRDRRDTYDRRDDYDDRRDDRRPSTKRQESDEDHLYRQPVTRKDSYKTATFAPEGVKVASSGLKYSSRSYDDERDDTRRTSMYERDTIETRPERSSKVYETRTTEIRPDDYRSSSYKHRPEYEEETRTVDITPGRDRKGSEVTRITRTTSNSLVPTGLEPRMNRLSVSGNRPDVMSLGAGGLPPASPLLEAYHGTYQSISPMPMALRIDDDIEEISLTSKKRVKLYDPEQDARTLAKALSSSVDAAAICEVLPPLSDDQIWELRKEYKKQVKIQGKGINLSKHLKMKLSGNFGKVVYVTALGRWESEGYWANFFYQSHGSRRELLIESLMGRTNAEIRSIKDEFKDKRYNDDLVRCMEKELKMDKFRSAILMALEGRRQEEQDVYPQEYKDRDVDILRRSVSGGGESAMLEIIVRRSDAHLRELLSQYEMYTGENFARVALKKSNNLVGEVVAHILNGVINKPARDALLLRHAIKDIAAHNKEDELRYELLISRLVRLHWDRTHLMKVKKYYKEKYGKYLEEDLEDSTKGDFREFVCELCDPR